MYNATTISIMKFFDLLLEQNRKKTLCVGNNEKLFISLATEV